MLAINCVGIVLNIVDIGSIQIIHTARWGRWSEVSVSLKYFVACLLLLECINPPQYVVYFLGKGVVKKKRTVYALLKILTIMNDP